MTWRNRGGYYPRDWDAKSAKARKAEPALLAQLAGVDLTAQQQADIDALPEPAQTKRRRVHHEDAAMDHVAVVVSGRWYLPGFQRFRPETTNVHEGKKRQQQGGARGWPDMGLWVPGRCRAVCELKAEHHRPARDPGSTWWWLDVPLVYALVRDARNEPAMAWRIDDEGEIKAQAHEVRAEQLFWLQTLAATGHATHVAYGAEDAIAWLDEQAGPRPDVMPW